MPFNLQNVNVGGDGRIKAALAIANSIQEERRKREQTEKEIALSDTLMKTALNDGRISDEEYEDYLKKPANAKHSAAVGQMANIADDFKEQQRALQRAQLSQREEGWTPPPEALARAEKLGLIYTPNSPRSGQWMDTRKSNLPAPGTPVYADDGSQLGVYDAKGKIVKLSSGKADPAAAMQETMRANELSGIDRQIAELQEEMAKGNKKSGPDWNPMATGYEDQLRGLLAKRAALAGTGTGAGKTSNVQRTEAEPSPTTMSEGGGPKSETASSGAPVIDSEEGYAAVPAGGMYVDARDGKLKRKKAAVQ